MSILNLYSIDCETAKQGKRSAGWAGSTIIVACVVVELLNESKYIDIFALSPLTLFNTYLKCL